MASEDELLAREDARRLAVVESNDREDHVAAGVVSVEEARAILLRFCHSHFDAHRQSDPAREKARMSIPANPRRDDDIRLGAFISRAAKAFALLDDVTCCTQQACQPCDDCCRKMGKPW